jgi:hypothetical protein
MPRERELEAEHRVEDEEVRRDRRADKAKLSLQESVGNRALGRVLSRKESPKSKGPTVTIGKLAIAVSGGNLAKWAANDVPDTLEVVSKKGPHSAQLERMANDRTKIASLTLTVAATNASGEELDLGSLSIEITNGRIGHYSVDGDVESWGVADFDGVHRTKTTHKVS